MSLSSEITPTSGTSELLVLEGALLVLTSIIGTESGFSVSGVLRAGDREGLGEEVGFFGI